MKLFSELKRITSQFFETEYFYRFRKLNKHVRAASFLNSTWEGDQDLLNILLLKIEHMFYNNKKFTDRYPQCIDASYFRDCKNKDDISFFRQYIGDYFFGWKPLCKENNWYYRRKEYWTDHTSDVVSKKRTKKCDYQNYTNYVYIGSDTFTDNNLNDVITKPGKVYYYYYDESIYDGYSYSGGRGIAYSYDTENMINISYVPSTCPMSEINKIVKEKTGSVIDASATIDRLVDIVPITIEDYKKLSDKAKAQVYGSRKILIEMLETRRVIKRILKLRPSSNNYDEKKKELYYNLADCLMKSDSWWD